MPKLTKRFKQNSAIVPAEPVTVPEAVAAIKKFQATKFDQSVDLVMHLGIDPTQADQLIRGSVSLPHGIGKSKRVVAFCQGDDAKAAIAAGAVKAGADELVTEIENGWMDFDVAIATPDMMRVVSKLGKVLGPKGLMPSPKSGTVTPKVAEAVAEYSAGKVEYRNDKGGNIHAVVGKMSFSADKLAENAAFFIQTVEKARPSSVKVQFVKKISIKGHRDARRAGRGRRFGTDQRRRNHNREFRGKATQRQTPRGATRCPSPVKEMMIRDYQGRLEGVENATLISLRGVRSEQHKRHPQAPARKQIKSPSCAPRRAKLRG